MSPNSSTTNNSISGPHVHCTTQMKTHLSPVLYSGLPAGKHKDEGGTIFLVLSPESLIPMIQHFPEQFGDFPPKLNGSNVLF